MMNSKATLYLFPVPMGQGSVADVLPEHNVALLRQVKFFAVENLRSARRFLKACDREIDIDSLEFFELSEHTRQAEVEQMLEPLRQGHDMGVISEAGCPAVADPGADLVALAQRHGFRVVPLVGPSSIIMSLMASGFNGQSFAFRGYLPVDEVKRREAFREMERLVRRQHQTQIFIETPYRNNRLIAELSAALPGDMLLCVASDITGPNERILTRPLSFWAGADYNYNKIPTIFLLYS